MRKVQTLRGGRDAVSMLRSQTVRIVVVGGPEVSIEALIIKGLGGNCNRRAKQVAGTTIRTDDTSQHLSLLSSGNGERYRDCLG